MAVMSYSGETLRRARVLAGLKQEELGKMVGSERSVARWEKTGLPERSPYLKAIEEALRLNDPTVLRAIADSVDQSSRDAVDQSSSGWDAPASYDEDPRELPDGVLLARLDAYLADLKRRYAEAVNPAQRRRLYGQPSPYPHHLDGHATSHDGEGSSHNRAGSTG